LFLAHVAQEFSDFFIVMLVDRAGWHTAKRLIVPENIRCTRSRGVSSSDS
jgi:hypothetical protein